MPPARLAAAPCSSADRQAQVNLDVFGLDVALALAFALWDRVASYTVLMAGVGVQAVLLAALGVALVRAS